VSRLAEITFPDAANRRGVLVIPIGSTEQHGAHLPLGTDTMIAVALAERLRDEHPEVTVAPAIAYGSSGEHQDFAGTLSIGQTALESVIVELVRSASHSFQRILLLNAHGGNAGPVARGVEILRAEGRDTQVWSPAAVWSGDAHAGHLETSVMLAIDPGAVRTERAAVGNTEPLAALLPTMVANGVAAVSTNGILGDPTTADADVGEHLIHAAVAALGRLVAAWPTDRDLAGART
jgi:mycofactocin precursor peptide peptidase